MMSQFERVYVWPVALIIIAVGAFVEFADLFSEEAKLAALILFWMYILCYGILDLEKRFAYTIFIFMIFVFLLSRPFFATLYGVAWKYWTDGVVDCSFRMLFVSMLALFVGCRVVSNPTKDSPYRADETLREKRNAQALLTGSIALMLICAMCQAYIILSSFFYYRNFDYAEIYKSQVSTAPYIIRVISNFFPLAVALFLSAMPSKKATSVVCFVYVAMGLPFFILGNRASLIVRIVFVTTYLLIRDGLLPTGQKWISKGMKIAFTGFVIASILFLGAFNYIRDNRALLDDSQIPLMADFFYKQGTTFDTICQGIEYKDKIEALPGDPNYTFGDLIDIFKYGRIGKFLFDTTDYPSGNNLYQVCYRSSLAHRLSYAAIGEYYYLAGQGRGSSYVIENYLDGGLPGVFLYSFLLGIILTKILYLFSRGGIIVRTIIVNAIMQLFLIPRSSASGFLAFLLEPYYWLTIVFALVILTICNRKNARTIIRLS